MGCARGGAAAGMREAPPVGQGAPCGQAGAGGCAQMPGHGQRVLPLCGDGCARAGAHGRACSRCAPGVAQVHRSGAPGLAPGSSHGAGEAPGAEPCKRWPQCAYFVA